ncbi:EAL domain-containing protein [Salinisphaera sp.]|uniref:EAL domain-containing protein n=1 Tax=Salinisphaera sp. TaxID=1914330 RepID=UPI0025D47277|nr:EAL domain-containing protein [Salinisphaera sp.]
MNQDLAVERIMQTGLLSCDRHTPLDVAAARMAERRCSSMLVMENDEPVGIWTEHDCLYLDFADPGALRQPIGDLMIESIATIAADASLGEAAVRFAAENRHHFLVVDEAETPLGILSRSDAVLNQGLESYLRLREVRHAMCKTPLVLPGTLTLGELASRMRFTHNDAAVITQPGQALGIITERDLVRFVAAHPGRVSVGELATRPLLSVAPGDTLIHARDQLIANRVRHLAVLDESEQVVGLLGFREMLDGNEQFYIEDLRQALAQRDQALSQSRFNLELAERVIDASLEGIIITDAQTHIEFVNPAFTHMTGYRPEEVIGRTPALLSSGRHEADFYERMWHSLKSNGYWRGEIWNRRKNGQLYLELLTVTAIRDEAGETTNYAALFSDITHIRENEEQVRRLAYYDALTRLPNRRLLEDRLSLSMRHAHRNRRRLAVIFIDLDHFKQVNDSLGHAIGDELLLQVSQRLGARLREDDTLARLGGDEFIALLPDLDEPSEATHIAGRLIAAISEPFKIDGHEFRVGGSLGISFYPDDAATIDDLMRNADAAMYRAKQEGRNTYRLFNSKTHVQENHHLAMESALRDTAETGEGLDVHYQPIFDTRTGALRGAEALLRWHHPRFGHVAPVDFIPVAERSGLILPLGRRLIRKVAGQQQRWLAAGRSVVPVAVNLSAKQFWQNDLPARLAAILSEHELPPGLIDVELTESTLLDESQQATHILQALRELGCGVAIDDFGTGYSSLRYLQDLPVTALKIDRSFVARMQTAHGSRAIVAAVSGLAHELGLKVVAEGVENASQLAELKQYPVHCVQGFHLGMPVSADVFAHEWLGSA